MNRAGCRQAVEDELQTLFAIEELAGFSHWSKQQIADSLASHTVFVIESDDIDKSGGQSVAGYAVFHAIVDELELLNIAIHPQYQRRGLAKSLLEYSLDFFCQKGISSCFLEVAANNEAARRLYQHCYFIEAGLRKNYYAINGEKVDALIMQRVFSDVGENKNKV